MVRASGCNVQGKLNEVDLKFRPMAREDFGAFYHTCFPRDRMNLELREVLEHEWHALYDAPGALSLVVEDMDSTDNERLIGCAQTIFLTEEFAAQVRAGLSPWLNAHVTRLMSDGPPPLLSLEGIRVANSGEGLIGLITRWMIADEGLGPDECLRLTDYLRRAFSHFSRGYKLKEIVVESTGEAARQEALQAGLSVLNDYALYYGSESPPAHARPCLFHLERVEALQRRSRGSLAARVFAYAPPRYEFGFTAREQHVLRWALVGADDREIGRRLDRSLWTVLKAWQGIYTRVEAKAPTLLPETDAERRRMSRRGDEKRRVLLRYLDEHPEELCPLSTSR